MELFIALRYLRGKRKIGFISLITYISAGGVLLGSLVLVVALAIANGFEKEVRDRIVGTLAHGKLLQYHTRPITAVDSMLSVVESAPRILAAAPFIEGKAGIEYEQIGEGVIVYGVDAARESGVTELSSKMVTGGFVLDSAESARGRVYPGVVLGLGLAEKLGIRPGHEIVLMSLSSSDYALDPTPRVQRHTVTGLFQTGFYEYDANLVYISIPAAQALFGVKGVHGIQFRTDDLFSSGGIAKQLQEYVGGYPYWATDWKAQNRSLFEWMRLEKLIIFIVISLIIVVAAFNIVSSLIMMILEKRREIGILMGLGATAGSIMRIFMFNGMVIGFLGSSAGTAIGVLLCLIQWRWQLIPLPGDIYFIDTLPVLLRPLDVISVYVAANVICLLATIYPAYQAARILPAESIRYE